MIFPVVSYFSFPIAFLSLGIIWARARLLPSCLFLAPNIRLIGGATFYPPPKTQKQTFYHLGSTPDKKICVRNKY